MTSVSSSAQKPLSSWPSAGLVLLEPGGVSGDASGGGSGGLAQRLAALLELRPLACPVERQRDAHQLLNDLAREPEGWLLPLALDPGAALPGGDCWAEALAAWRQPALLLLPALQAGAGPDRAYAALLEAAAVPLLGLVQLGGPWQSQSRRADRLAWLGWLPGSPGAPGGEEELAEQQLRLVLQARWRLSSARAAEPDCPPA
jgi:hypothetical protein